MIVGYFIITFLVFFITYKLRIEKFKEEGNSSSYYSKEWVSRQSFWIMFLIPLFWIIAIPAILAWKLLDKVYNKLTSK